MKTFPDFTWEYLAHFHDEYNKNMQKLLELKPPPETSERVKRQLAINEKLNRVVSKLRAHPQLKEYVPMKSMFWLRWFPAAHREIQLDVEGTTDDYLITIITEKHPLDWEINEEKIVALDDVADEIYAYITKLRDD